MAYANVDVELYGHRRTRRGERLKVRIAASPEGGMARAEAVTVAVPAEARDLTVLVERREAGAGDLVRLGRLLGDVMLPPGPVRERFERCRGRVAGLDRLRVRLRVDSGALADLPWEYAHVPRPDAAAGDEAAGFLALDRRLALVRHQPARRAVETLAPVAGGDLRLVALLATPVDPAYPALAVDDERAAIASAVRRLAALSTTWVEHATPDALTDALSRPAHAFHFAGHGLFRTDLGEALGSVEGEGFLVLEDDQHRPHLLGAEEVALTLSAMGVRLAVLGACHSGRRDSTNPWAGVAPALIRTAGIPAAVGMQFTIDDRAAARFSRRLYELLADGAAVEEAVTAGRIAIAVPAVEAGREWGVPVLYLGDEGGAVFPVAPAVTWEGLVERARAATARVLREWRGDGQGRWLPELFTDRPAVAGAWAAFLAGEAGAVMVVAPSGYGKTTEMARRAEAWAAAGHAVALVDAARLAGDDVEAEVTGALGLEGGLAAAPLLSAERQLVVLVDGVNEFTGPAAGPGTSAVEALVEALDRLAGRLPAHCRLVATCSQPAWDRLDQLSASRGRMGPLTPSRWHRPERGGPGILLPAFDPAEAAGAFGRYAGRFRLATAWEELGPAARAELSVPLVMRLCSEAYQGGAVPPLGAGITVLRARWERLSPPEREVAQELARALLDAGASSLALPAAARRSPLLGRAMAAGAGPYASLVEGGVLTEAYDPGLLADRVGFSHARFGAFVAGVAALADADSRPEEAVRGLVSPGATSLAWDAARLLLAAVPGPEVIGRLAGDASPDVRQVAVGALVERHAEDPAGAGRLLRAMLEGGADQAGAWRQGSGFKATLELGGAGLEHLRWAVTHRTPSLRRAAGAVIALHWERDAAFTDRVLDDLSRAIRFRQPRRARRLLEAMTEVNIPVYMAHCDDPEVAARTARLWKDVLKTRLRLHLLVPRLLDRVLVPVVSAAFARRIGEAAVLGDVQPPSLFFSLPDEERRRFLRTVARLDPAAPLDGDALDDLTVLLGSDVAPCGILGGLVLAVHGYADPGATGPAFDRLWERLAPVGRLWALSAFSVLIRDPAAAGAWRPRLDRATRALAARAPAVFFGEEPSVPAALALQALPAGLAAAKLGQPPAVLTRLAGRLGRHGRGDRVAVLWGSLGVLGLFHPEPVLAAAWTVVGRRPAPDAALAMAGGLGTMRIGRPDLVDRFLAEVGASAEVRNEVAKAGDPAAVRRVTYALGLYNNAVHQALHYRPMRERLLIGGLRALGEADSLAGFVRAYTPVPIAMVREADFDLLRWTR